MGIRQGSSHRATCASARCKRGHTSVNVQLQGRLPTISARRETQAHGKQHKDLVGTDAGKGWRQRSGVELPGCSIPAEAPTGPCKVPRGWEAEPASQLYLTWLSKAGASHTAETERRQPPRQDRGDAGGERGAPSPGRLHSWALLMSKVISNERRSNFFFHGHCIRTGILQKHGISLTFPSLPQGLQKTS